MTKIIFISHEASRTGAPILLLRLMQALKNDQNISIVTILRNGGELQDQFEKLGKTYLWRTKREVKGLGVYLYKLKRKLGFYKNESQTDYNSDIIEEVKGADFIINNTITNGPLLKQLPLSDKRVFTYIHEMKVITSFSSTDEDINYVYNLSEKIFVPAKAVKEFLMNEYGLGDAKFRVLRYIIPYPTNHNLQVTNSIELANGNLFKVGFCGTLHWRKGYDLLPLIGKIIVKDKAQKDIRFHWIGTNLKSFEYGIVANDIAKMGLTDYFKFSPVIDNIYKELKNIDILVLPSREDAFPLVVLEAACLGIPTIYFKNAGGIGEFLEDDAGVAVDYLDINSMAEAILMLKSNDQLRKSMGMRVKEKMEMTMSNEKVVQDFKKYLGLN